MRNSQSLESEEEGRAGDSVRTSPSRVSIMEHDSHTHMMNILKFLSQGGVRVWFIENMDYVALGITIFCNLASAS